MTLVCSRIARLEVSATDGSNDFANAARYVAQRRLEPT